MLPAVTMYVGAVLCIRVQTEILKRERNARWLHDHIRLTEPGPGQSRECRPHPTTLIEHNMDITHYFDMGKYSAYVWSSYGLSALVLLANLLVALRAHRNEYRCTGLRLERGRPSVS